MIVLKFDTWEEFDDAIGSIATAFAEASKEAEQRNQTVIKNTACRLDKMSDPWSAQITKW